jgi:hypothetical protein
MNLNNTTYVNLVVLTYVSSVIVYNSIKPIHQNKFQKIKYLYFGSIVSFGILNIIKYMKH